MGRALLVLNNDHDRETACRWARGVPLGSRIEFKETKRSLPQNDLMWALLTEVAQQMDHGGRKYDATEWKSIFLHAFGREISFLPSLDLKTFLPIELSSSDLGKDEMTNFIEFILKEGTERGVIFREQPNTPSEAVTPLEDASVVDGNPPAEDTTLPSEPEGDVSPSSGSSIPADGFEPIPQKELPAIRLFARIALKTAGTKGMEQETLTKVMNRSINADLTNVQSKSGKTAVNQIRENAKSVLSDDADYFSAVDFYAEMLGVTSDELMGEPDHG